MAVLAEHEKSGSKVELLQKIQSSSYVGAPQHRIAKIAEQQNGWVIKSLKALPRGGQAEGWHRGKEEQTKRPGFISISEDKRVTRGL